MGNNDRSGDDPLNTLDMVVEAVEGATQQTEQGVAMAMMQEVDMVTI